MVVMETDERLRGAAGGCGEGAQGPVRLLAGDGVVGCLLVHGCQNWQSSILKMMSFIYVKYVLKITKN